jgi:hypothetical protein
MVFLYNDRHYRCCLGSFQNRPDFFPLRQQVWEEEAREICETSRFGIEHGSNYSIWTLV